MTSMRKGIEVLYFIVFLVVPVFARGGSICSNSTAAPYTLKQLATICDETFAVTNATGFYSFDPGLFTSNFSGPSPNITFAQTLYATDSSAAAAVWMDTGPWDFANDVGIGYDACAIRIDGLTTTAQYNALHSDGTCTSVLGDTCLNDIQELASSTADSLVINGKDQSLPTYELGLVCQNIQDAVNANFPSSCKSYYNASAFLVAYGEPLTQYNYTNSDESCVNNREYGCTLNKTYWAIAGQREYSGDGVSLNQVYDTMAHTVFQVLTVFFSVASEYRTIVNPAQAHLACLHVENFTAGSRVSPPFPPPPSNNLGGGQITGIVLGVLFGTLLIAGLGFWWLRRRRSGQAGSLGKVSFWNRERSQAKIEEVEEKTAPGELPGDFEKSELSASHAVLELGGDQRKRAELDAEYAPIELPADNEVASPYPADEKESIDSS